MPDTPTQHAQVTGAEIVSLAESIVKTGVPYVYGGTTMSGFDCSGLVQYLYAHFGITVPRTSEEQATVGNKIDESALQPGDLIFSQWPGDGAEPGHVAVYIGSGNLIEAPHTGEDVHIAPLNDAYKAQVTEYRTVPGLQQQLSGSDNPVSSVVGAVQGAASSLISFPSQITSFFSAATDQVEDVGSLLAELRQPSTWVRGGAGLFGLVFLLAGTFFLIREARS